MSLTHSDVVSLINHLAEVMPKAFAFTPAEWAKHVVTRNGVQMGMRDGVSLSEGYLLRLKIIDSIFDDYAAVAWEAFQREEPDLAKWRGYYWEHLRSLAAEALYSAEAAAI